MLNARQTADIVEINWHFTMIKQDCIVIGGGIVGMTTARELAMRGLSVSIFDKGRLGMESSWAAGGILSSMRPWLENAESSALSNKGKAYYADFVAELKQQTGIDTEYYQSGLLLINAADITQLRLWSEKNQILTVENYADYPSNMSLPSTSIFLPEIAQVRTPTLLKALHVSLLKLGVSIFENTPITGLEIDDNRCISAKTGEDKHYANSFIISAGPWSGKILGAGNKKVQLKPVLGQMLCVKFPKPPFVPIVLDGEHYFIPRKDGHTLIGSTMEEVGFSKNLTNTAKNMLMQWACTLYPDIAKTQFIKHWAGLRPATDNGKPYLGRLEAYENIYMNAGHFRKGILQAPICAREIAGMVCS